MSEPVGRRTYLLDGRRVRLSDLIDAGLLDVGQQLHFMRARSGDLHVASLDGSGNLIVDGRKHTTPSGAARSAAGSGQFDGWTAWSNEAGESLHALRLRLLDNVAAEAEATTGTYDDGAGDSDAAVARHEYLKAALGDARSGAPRTVVVRDFLRHWNAFARGWRVSSQISADLDIHGLTTEPDFLSVSLDDEVALQEIRQHEIPESADATDHEEAPSDGNADRPKRDRHDIGLTLGNLVTPWRPLESVKPTASIDEAITKMLVNEYSQLPVMTSPYNLVGAVTWRSITRARLKNPDASLAAATVDARKHSFGDELHDVLPTLQNDDFVVVADPHNKITGIVTTADVAALYHERTLPFLLIGELDQELRRLLENSIPFDAVRAACATPGRAELTSFDELSMGDYQRVLETPDCWAKLEWPLDRKTMIDRLEELRKVRNDVAHFNPDPVPPGTVDKLRYMLAVIRSFSP